MPIWLTTKLFGISHEFYDGVFRPFQGFQFTTLHLDSIPAVALPALDDIVPLTGTRMHMSWGDGNSSEVFLRATKGIDVRLDTRVRQVG